MERVPEFILVSKSKRGHLYENQTYFLRHGRYTFK